MITVWLLALLFVVGVTSILFNKFLEGVYLVAAAAFSAVGAFAYWLEKRPRRKPPRRPRRDRDDDLEAVPHGFGPLERGLSQPSGQPAGRAAAGSDRGTLVDRLAGLRSGLRGGLALLETHQYSKALGNSRMPRNPDDGPDAIPQAAPSPVKMGQTPEPAGREIGRMRAEERGQGSGDRGQRRQRRIPIDSNCPTSDISHSLP